MENFEQNPLYMTNGDFGTEDGFVLNLYTHNPPEDDHYFSFQYSTSYIWKGAITICYNSNNLSIIVTAQHLTPVNHPASGRI